MEDHHITSKFVLAALGLAAPAFAEETTAIDPAKSAGFAALLTASAAQHQARLQLAHQGYVNISLLEQDTSGGWVGTAMKDGKQAVVAVNVRKAQPEAATN